MKLSKRHLETLKSLAISSAEKRNLPNAAMLVDKSGRIIASSKSLVASNRDATAHAELLVISKTCKKRKKPVIPEYRLITVLEPCLMCLGAAYWAGLNTIYYIVPAKRYWHKIPWIAESTGFSKAPLVKKFSEKIIYKHLNLYEGDFRAIFDSYLGKVIKRKLD